MTPDRMALKAALLRTMIPGEFLGTSGTPLSSYVDVRAVALDNARRRCLGRSLASEVERDYDVVAGPLLGGALVALAVRDAVEYDHERPTPEVSVIRTEPRQHGLRQQIEGASVVGRKVLLVDDVMTTGGSVMKAADILEQAAAEVVGVAVVVDRRVEADPIFGTLPLWRVFTLDDLTMDLVP